MLRNARKTVKNRNILAKAIIPAAGHGTRFHPLTLSVPKELLPVNRKPMIQLAVEEALATGIQEIGIVIRKGKEEIRNYFEAIMASSDSLLEGFKNALARATLKFIFQEKPLGLGNAIFEARDFIKDSPFVMLIPDQYVRSNVPAGGQLLKAAKEDFQGVWSSVVSVSKGEQEFFPGARRLELVNKAGNIWEVKGLSEDKGDSNQETLLLAFGRTFFPKGILEFFSDRYINSVTGEVDLLLTFEALIKERTNYAVQLDGRAMDFGTWAGYEYFSPKMFEQVFDG
jgi:UTP--glucose-1-phosphate uridylyltransferase